MNDDLVTFTVVALISLLVSGFISYAVLFKPQLGNKLIQMGKTDYRRGRWAKMEMFI